MKKYLLLSGLLFLLFCACKKNDFKPATQATIDDDKIKAYIAANNIPAVKDPSSGIYYQVLVDTGGTHPTEASTVKVTYTGKLLNGTIFQDKQTSTLLLTNTISGWIQGIPLVGNGGRIRLIIPSGLGYGKDGSSTGLTPVPSNAILDFTIDLLGFY